MFNHSHTILLITRQVLARIDLIGRKRLRVKQVWTMPACDFEEFLPVVSRALKLGNRRSGRVTVVSPDFWTGVLSIPDDITAVAREKEILQALALEAEVESGLSAFDSRTSALQIGELERGEGGLWCVTQIPLDQIRELARILKSSGAKLHSIAHPIAPQLFSKNLIDVDTVQTLLNTWRDRPTLGIEEVQTLAIDWAALFSQHPPHPMLILAESESAPNSQPIALTASLALLAAGACGLCHWRTNQILASTFQSIESLEKQHNLHTANEAALKNTEATAQQLRLEASKAQSVRQTAEQQLQLADKTHSQNNGRWLALVDALAQSADEACWVQKLESTSEQTIVHGLALDHASANSFAGRLECALKGSNWRTTPAATAVSSHKLVAFKIVLQSMLKHDERTNDSRISLMRSSVTPTYDLARRSEP